MCMSAFYTYIRLWYITILKEHIKKMEKKNGKKIGLLSLEIIIMIFTYGIQSVDMDISVWKVWCLLRDQTSKPF